MEWRDVAELQRSHEDPKVWVPVVEDGDYEPFLHSGGLLRAKRYVRSLFDDGQTRLRWERTDSDRWTLWAADIPS